MKRSSKTRQSTIRSSSPQRRTLGLESLEGRELMVGDLFHLTATHFAHPVTVTTGIGAGAFVPPIWLAVGALELFGVFGPAEPDNTILIQQAQDILKLADKDADTAMENVNSAEFQRAATNLANASGNAGRLASASSVMSPQAPLTTQQLDGMQQKVNDLTNPAKRTQAVAEFQQVTEAASKLTKVAEGAETRAGQLEQQASAKHAEAAKVRESLSANRGRLKSMERKLDDINDKRGTPASQVRNLKEDIRVLKGHIQYQQTTAQDLTNQAAEHFQEAFEFRDGAFQLRAQAYSQMEPYAGVISAAKTNALPFFELSPGVEIVKMITQLHTDLAEMKAEILEEAFGGKVRFSGLSFAKGLGKALQGFDLVTTSYNAVAGWDVSAEAFAENGVQFARFLYVEAASDSLGTLVGFGSSFVVTPVGGIAVGATTKIATAPIAGQVFDTYLKEDLSRALRNLWIEHHPTTAH